MEFGTNDYPFTAVFWLAILGAVVATIGTPVALFFLIRWLVMHLQWI